jgi:Grap2 and cyclin-D-interacting
MASFSGPSPRSVAARIQEVFDNVQTVVMSRGQGHGQGSRWRNDETLQQAINNIKAGSQAFAMSCSKLALLLPKAPAPDVLGSLLEELVANTDAIMVVYLQFVDCSVSKPLFDMVSSLVRSQLGRGKEFMDLAASASPDFGEISNSAGIIFKLYDQVQTLPMTNKAAYRRFTMERLAILNDTISEFTRYVAVAREGGGAPPRQQGGDEDEDDEDDEDDEPYTFEEVETVEACLRSMECSTQALKLALATMTHVADLVTPSTPSISVAENEREACDAWVAELYGLARRTEDNVTDLGAELYAPFDMQKVAEYHAALGATLQELTATLRRPAFASRLSPQLVAELGGLDILRLALSLSAVL